MAAYGVTADMLYTPDELKSFAGSSRSKRYGKPSVDSRTRAMLNSGRARFGVVSARRMGRMSRTGGYSFKSVGGTELNFVDTTINSSAVSTTPYSVLCNGVAAGSSASQRIGRRITIKSIEFRGVAAPGAAAHTSSASRHVLVLDKQPNSALATYADVYDTTPGVTPYNVRNISNAPRFQVLWDSGVVCINGNDTTAGQQTANTEVGLNVYKRCNIPVQFTAAGGATIGDISTNSLVWISIGEYAAASNYEQSIRGVLRIRYEG